MDQNISHDEFHPLLLNEICFTYETKVAAGHCPASNEILGHR
jgi:hypothetical protein